MIAALDQARYRIAKDVRSPDRAIGQLARYMGWVRQTIGKGRQVRDVIVAKTVSESLRYAVTLFPDVSLFEYDIRFTLGSVPPPVPDLD